MAEEHLELLRLDYEWVEHQEIIYGRSILLHQISS